MNRTETKSCWTRYSMRTLALSGALLMMATNASAVTIEARVDYTLGGISPAGSPDISGPATSGSVDVLDGDALNGNDVFYHTYGNVGGNFGSRVSGNGTFDISGVFNFAGTFEATSLAPIFNFDIIPGAISTNSSILSGSDELFASYELDIRLDGTTIWNSAAAITTNDGGSSCALTGTTSTGNEDISRGGSTCTVGTSNYLIGGVNRSIALGPMAFGQLFDIEYELTTIARGNLSSGIGCGGPGEGDGGRDDDREVAFLFLVDAEEAGSCGGATARIGDPFSISGSTGSAASIVGAQAVDEPVVLALVGLGLIGMSVRRKRAN